MTLEELCEKNTDRLAEMGVTPAVAHRVFIAIWETALDYAELQEDLAMQIVADWLQI